MARQAAPLTTTSPHTPARDPSPPSFGEPDGDEHEQGGTFSNDPALAREVATELAARVLAAIGIVDTCDEYAIDLAAVVDVLLPEAEQVLAARTAQLDAWRQTRDVRDRLRDRIDELEAHAEVYGREIREAVSRGDAGLACELRLDEIEKLHRRRIATLESRHRDDLEEIRDFLSEKGIV